MKGEANWFKRHTGILATVEFVIILGLATSTVLLAVSKDHVTSQPQVSSQQTATKQQVAKTGSCSSGTTQRLGDGKYLVGQDLQYGTYVIANDGATDAPYAGLDIYQNKQAYASQDLNNENTVELWQPNETQTVKVDVGNYIVVSISAKITCQ